MKVPLIKTYFDQAIAKLEDGPQFAITWQNMHSHFSKNWDIEALDFLNMYSSSIESQISRRLWKREDWYPKEVMEKCITLDKEFVRSIFKDLFHPSKDLNMRMSRFSYHCDILLKEAQSKGSTFIDHYHNGFEMPFLYLNLQDPENYGVFKKQAFERFLNSVESKRPSIIEASQVAIIFKVLHTLLSSYDPFVKAIEKWQQSMQLEPLPVVVWSSLCILALDNAN